MAGIDYLIWSRNAELVNNGKQTFNAWGHLMKEEKLSAADIKADPSICKLTGMKDIKGGTILDVEIMAGITTKVLAMALMADIVKQQVKIGDYFWIKTQTKRAPDGTEVTVLQWMRNNIK